MADIANQLQGASEGLERFLDALDNSSMKLGSNAAIESKLAREAAKKADQDLRFRKKIEKMEKEAAKREAEHLARLKAMEPFRKKAFNAIKQEIKAKADLLKQTKGLGDALKKTGAGLGGMFKSLGAGLKSAMRGLGKGFEGGVLSGLKGMVSSLKEFQLLGVSVGQMFGALAAGVKVVYDLFSQNERLMADITRQTGIMGDTFKKGFRAEVLASFEDLGRFGYTLKEVTKLTQDMREAFGDTSLVTNDLVKTSGMLQIAFRMSAENANELVEAMTRSGYQTDQFLGTVRESAIIMGADLGMAVRDVAKNTGMLELYAGRGAEYFARMAGRAAMLGTDMKSIEDAGSAFEDFTAMAERFNVMGQLFGPEFHDGLKNLNDIRMMYERGNVLGIQEHIAEQAAKTLYYENGILKSMKTKEGLFQSQIKSMADALKIDNVSALRMLKAAEMAEMFQNTTEGTFEIEEKMLKNAEAKELLAASTFDFNMAMFSALRDAGKTEKEITELLSTQDKSVAQQKADRIELLKLADAEFENRDQLAKKQKDMEQLTLDSMTLMQQEMAKLNETFTTLGVTAGKEIGDAISGAIKKAQDTGTAVSDSLKESIDKFNKGEITLEGLQEAMRNATAAGVTTAFDGIDPQDVQGKGIAGIFETALVNAVGGDVKGGEGIFSAIYNQLTAGADYLGEILTEIYYGLEDMFASVVRDLRIALDKMSFIGTGGANRNTIEYNFQQDELERVRDRARASFEKQIEETENQYYALRKIKERTEEQEATFKSLNESLQSLSKQMQDAGKAAYDQRLAELEASGELIERENAERIRGVRAKGWSGSQHRAIVGEAGTEVGITRNALRELASIGVPAYQDGFGGFGNVGGLYQAPGSTGARRQRGADNRRVGEDYRDEQRDFLDNLYRDQYEFSRREEQRQANFFIKYPAIVDEAFGRPFRDRGPIATGIYNSIFSGLQAGARAEFRGASAERQREIAFQHAVAEGIKEGGIINQGLDKLVEVNNKIYNNGKDVTKADRAQIGLLGGIQHGLQAMAGVIASGGSREQALEMGKRGAIGGIVRNFTASFGGQADSEFLQSMDMMGYILGMKKMPAGTGRSTGDMITEALNRTERTFQSQGRGLGYSGASLPYGGANAMGRVFNSPHIAVVGEGSQNEIIVPTERIRKGLPINEGVARELASIGVPGYQDGFSFSERFRAGTDAAFHGDRSYTSGGYAGRLGHSYQSMGGAAGGFATAGMQFANTYMQTGDMGMAAGQALGAGIGFGATMAISAIPGVGPFIGPILGPMIGSFIGSKLGGALGYKPKHKKFRERTLKSLESHVLTEGLFDHGQPAGIKDNIEKAIAGGKKKHPTEQAFNRLVNVVNASKVLKRGFMHPGINGEGLLALLSGQVGNTDQENAMYARYNNAFYGNPVPMATGGIVTRPTNAIVGEAGPEAVIPLNTVGGYSSRDQERDNKTMIDELRRSNQQMQMFIKQIGNARTVLNVDGRQLAETVGQNMYEINTGM